MAVIDILEHCRAGEWVLAASDAIDFELSQMKDVDKLLKVRGLYSIAGDRLETVDEVEKRSLALQKCKMTLFDSLHLALAETYKQDVLLTTDDGMIKLAENIRSKVPVVNPVTWLMEVIR
jgi:predicted nucleic acid-binding protein